MSKRIFSGILVSLLLIGILTLAFNIQPVKASGTIYIRADGSIDPPTAPIYTADNITYTLTGNVTAEADGIVVERDNIVLDGAGYTVTGSGSGNGITLTNRSNVTVRSMTIKNFAYGISLDSSSGNTLSGNNVTANNDVGISLYYSSGNTLSGNNVTANNYYGIWLFYSSGNTLSGNNVTNNGYGIRLISSSGNALSGNVMAGNQYNFDVLYDFLQSVDTSNLVDDKPVYYFVNQSDLVVNAAAYPEVGYLGFVNCDNVTVQGLNLTGNGQGLLLACTSDSKITGNNLANNGFGIILYSSSDNALSGNNVTANNVIGIWLDSSSGNALSGNAIANNEYGIWLYPSSSNNTLSGNNVTNNYYGIEIDFSSNNSVFHNSFVNNRNQVFTMGSSNIWDGSYPLGGNYWSDYTGSDSFFGAYQNLTGSDGIGDTPYNIDVNNVDHYPLMSPYEYWSNPILGDVNRDMKVDMSDVETSLAAFGSYPTHPRWNPVADVDENGRVDMGDIIIVLTNFGQHYP